MQNLTIGLVLIGLALLVGVVLLLYQFGPELGVAPLPSTEADEPVDEDAIVQITVGGDQKTEEILEDAKRRLSLDYARELIDQQTRTLSPEERATLDDRKQFAHVVRKGETLSSLAREYLGDDKLWQAILSANPELRRPEDLREGQSILIPSREAK